MCHPSTRLFQLSFGQQVFQGDSVLLEFFEPLSTSSFRSTILIPLPVIGLFGNPEFTVYVSHGLSFTRKPVCLAKFPSNLFRRVARSLTTCRVIHAPQKRGVMDSGWRF